MSGFVSASFPVMGRRDKIAATAAAVMLFLIAMWLTLHRGAAEPGLSVAFATARAHFPDPALVVGDYIIVAWVTNTGPSAITLDLPYVQFATADGRLVRDQGCSWHQQGCQATLSPGSATWLANGFDPDRQRLRFAFEYHSNGGSLLRAISKAARILPLKRLPVRTYEWLRRNGMVDGAVYRHHGGPWIANPQGGANGRRPVTSGTSSTSAAAAFRR